MYLIAAAVLALVAVQAFWLVNSLEVAGQKFDKDLYLRMERIAETMEEDMVCFELYAKRTIAKGDEFFLLVPGGEGQPLDTVESYYWHTPGEDTLWRQRHFNFSSAPASVEINMRFNYLLDPARMGQDSLSDMEAAVQREFSHSLLFADEDFELKLLDTLLLARVVAEELAPLEARFKYGYAVIDIPSGEALVNKAHELSNGYVQPMLTGQNFIRPLELRVFISNRSWGIFMEFVPMVAAFVVVIAALLLLLILSYRSVQQQRRLAQMRVDLVNNMTHEFNTPIANIGLALDTLRKQPSGTGNLSAERILEMIGSENMRLKENIDRVMKVSLMDGGGLDLAWAEVDVHELIRELEDRFELAKTTDNGRIKPILKAEGSKIKGDRTHLRNAIYNLIDNALKYSSGRADVEIETTNTREGLLVEVRDQGIGIAARDVRHIFDKFFRVHSGSRHDVKGFGLGLHYVKTIVDAHSGRIEVSSKPGRGTTFRLQFPTV